MWRNPLSTLGPAHCPQGQNLNKKPPCEFIPELTIIKEHECNISTINEKNGPNGNIHYQSIMGGMKYRP